MFDDIAKAIENGALPAAAPFKLRILLVDDNRQAIIALGKQLRGKGHRVELAFDGESALVAAAQLSPDVVVLDINMPGIDGFAAATTLRGGEHRAAIIALTGRAAPEDKRRGVAAGFDRYLVKPASLEEIEEAIRQAGVLGTPAGAY
jgi:CheY-like chemotaxis protein